MGRYFFAVERARDEYFASDPRSWADWAQWVPVFNPDAVRPLPRVRAPAPRFLIWDNDDPLPRAYECARGQSIARFEPAGGRTLASLGWIADSNDRGYEPFTIYRLAADCPTGYDPTASRAPQGRLLR
jgi:hypothetical protein